MSATSQTSHRVVRTLLEGFRGWVSPRGDQFDTDPGEDHGRHASRLLTQFYPTWNWEDNPEFQSGGAVFASYALENKGWVRVVDDGTYTVDALTPSTRAVLTELVSAIDDDTSVIIGVRKGKSLRQTSKEQALQWLDTLNEDEEEHEAEDYKDMYEPAQKAYLKVGTIIQGTMRIKDVAPALIHALMQVDFHKGRELMIEYENLESVDERDYFCWEKLFNVLNRYAPPFTYVGPHEGNGSDYGCWVNREALDQALEEGDKIKAVTSGVPMDDLKLGTTDFIVVMDPAGDYRALLDGRSGEALWEDG